MSTCIATDWGGRSLTPPGGRPDDEVDGMYDLHGNMLEWTTEGIVHGARYCPAPLGWFERAPEEGYSYGVGFRCMAVVR